VTKAKISEYSATANDNTDVNNVNIAEGCAPSGINNAIREVMAALKRFQTGTDSDPVTIGGNLIVTGGTTANTLSATNVTASGTLGVTGASTFTGTLSALGNASVGGTLGVTGSSTFTGTLSALGNASVGGTLGVTGASTFTGTLSALGNASVGGTLGVTGASTFTGTIAAQGRVTLASAIHEARVDLSTATQINVSQANYFIRTITTDTTFTVTGTPATGTVASYILDLTNGGSATITWATGTVWAGGTAPTLTSSGRDVLGFFTHNGGGAYNGFVLGKDVK